MALDLCATKPRGLVTAIEETKENETRVSFGTKTRMSLPARLARGWNYTSGIIEGKSWNRFNLFERQRN